MAVAWPLASLVPHLLLLALLLLLLLVLPHRLLQLLLRPQLLLPCWGRPVVLALSGAGLLQLLHQCPVHMPQLQQSEKGCLT